VACNNKKEVNDEVRFHIQTEWGIPIFGIRSWILQVECIRKHLVVFKSDTSFGPEIKSRVPRKALASQTLSRRHRNTLHFTVISAYHHHKFMFGLMRSLSSKIIVLKLLAKFHVKIPHTLLNLTGLKFEQNRTNGNVLKPIEFTYTNTACMLRLKVPFSKLLVSAVIMADKWIFQK